MRVAVFTRSIDKRRMIVIAVRPVPKDWDEERWACDEARDYEADFIKNNHEFSRRDTDFGYTLIDMDSR